MKVITVTYKRMTTMTAFQNDKEAENEHRLLVDAWTESQNNSHHSGIHTIACSYGKESYRLSKILKIGIVEYNNDCRQASINLGVWGGQIGKEIDRLVDEGRGRPVFRTS